MAISLSSCFEAGFLLELLILPVWVRILHRALLIGMRSVQNASDDLNILCDVPLSGALTSRLMYLGLSILLQQYPYQPQHPHLPL